ncbi:MAG: PQQ-binding-like beta-propeller repeat protein [Pirellulales bacterium]|nr:PQQ-binding-like beta-propeller repeat protein [Pirellulales bacterium]
MQHRTLFVGLISLALVAPIARAADWPQWGGRDCRNMVSGETGLPDFFEPGQKSPDGSGIDLTTTANVRWAARLGSAAYGNPTVADGRVFVGTDDLTVAEDPRFKRTRGGIVKCLDEATGRMLWQLVVPVRTRLPEGLLFGHQHLGICSSPAVDADRVYVVTSAAEVVCLDAKGQADGNDGPFLEEGQYMAGPDEKAVDLKPSDGDILWRFDLIDELGIRPHDATSCSILIHGDLLYLSTSNGVDKPHEKVLAPDAPAIVALDKRTGNLAALEAEHLSSRLYHCQWSSPSLGRVEDETLVFFGGGDGVCYAFEAISHATARPAPLKKAWSCDCNPPEYKYRDGVLIPYYLGDKRKAHSPNQNDGKYVGPSQIIATPVLDRERVYVAIGQDPAHGRGKGLLHCIDATKTGDITHTGRVWTYDGLDRTIGTATVADGLVYIVDVAGRLHCVDADSGEPCWVYETNSEAWGSPLVADGKVFFGTQKSFYIMAAGREARLLSKIALGSPVYSSPIVANGTLYVASQRYLWAVKR